MQMGPIQLLLIAVVVLVLFGRGKVSSLMGEVGRASRRSERACRTDRQTLKKTPLPQQPLRAM